MIRATLLILFAVTSTNAQDICDIARQPSTWTDKKVTIRGLLSLTRHDAALIPINEPASYRGDCAIFPLLGATPPGMRAGVKEGVADSTVAHTMTLYRRHLASDSAEQWCFVATGFVKAIRDYRYDRAKGEGNGFGYKGYYPVALLVQTLSRTRCASAARQ